MRAGEVGGERTFGVEMMIVRDANRHDTSSCRQMVDSSSEAIVSTSYVVADK